MNKTGMVWRLPTHLALFSGPSFADFNMHHPPSSESITSISRVEAEAQAARFRWFNPSLTVTTLSVVIVKNEWWCSHGGLSAKKCDCGDWTCGLAICVGWEMNQSLIYEVTQHSLPSVLAQLSSLQSHPAQQVALWTFVGFRTTKSFRSFILQANGCWIKEAYVLSHIWNWTTNDGDYKAIT